MNFGFTQEQEELRSQLRRFLDERAPMGEVRRISETEEGFCRALWKEMAELGFLGLTIPEALGGSGLAWVDLVVLLEETGRSLLPSPLLTHTLAATALLQAGSAEQQDRWLPRLADGSLIGSLALMEDSDFHGAEGIALMGQPDGTRGS